MDELTNKQTNKLTLVLLLCFSMPLYAAEPQVSTDTGRQKSTEDSQQISREKAIDLQRSAKDSTADAIDKMRARTYSTDLLKQFTSRADTQAAVLFEQLVSAIERGEVDMGENPVSDLFRRCGLYSYPHPSPSALFIGSEEEINAYGNRWLTPPQGTPTHVSVSGNALYKYHPQMELKPQRFATPAAALRCYMGYSYVLSETIKEMASQSIGSQKHKGKDSQTYFVLDSLERLTARALVAVIADPDTMGKIDRLTEQTLAGGCMLPTLAALNSGNYTWTCGGIDVDPSKGLAKRSGTPYFGENTFMGTSALFAQVDAYAMTQGLSDSDIKRHSKMKEIAKARSTRLSKKRGQSSSVSSGESLGTGSGVSQ
jgi:hypothetical protein